MNKESKAAYAKEWRKKNPDLVKAASVRTRAKNKEKIYTRQKAWSEANPDKRRVSSRKYYEREKPNIRRKQLEKEFGITKEAYDAMLLSQNGTCAICNGGPDATNKTLAVDHCHKTGKIRGLLCRGCNVGIGNLKDDPNLLEKAIIYIRRSE